MQPRKLIRLGNSSYAIALPKDWIEKSGLKKGDDVYVEKNSNGEIVISPKFKNVQEDSKIVINVDNIDNYQLEKEMKSAYVKGYKEIHFEGQNNKNLKETIDNIKLNLLSLEFLENGKDKIVVKDLLNIEDINIDNFIKRIDNNLKEGFETLIKSLESGKLNKKDLDEVKKIDDDINKSYMLISRLLLKGLDNPSIITLLKVDTLELFNKWWFSFNLEHIGDRIKSISKIMSLNDIEINTELNNFIKELYELYLQSMESYYKREKKLAMNAMKKSFSIHNKYKNEFQSTFSSKVSENLKNLQDSCYQNLKMTLYMRT